ncbi:MAG: hypothetical protein IPH28_23535 [Cytophagaceae bacterium]|nr:hypothetical protein [Cytophagaceae bacterium]
MPKLKLPVLPESLPKVISLLNLSRNEMWFLVAYISFSILGMTLTPLFDEDEGFLLKPPEICLQREIGSALK